MMSYMLSRFIDHIIYNIIYDIILYRSYMMSPLPSIRRDDHTTAVAGANFPPAIRTDHGSDSDQVMDSLKERDFADQGPPSDFELEEDTQILATLLEHIPACIITFVERKVAKVLMELLSDERMAGHQHFGFKLSTNANGDSLRVLGGDANGSVSFELPRFMWGLNSSNINCDLH